MMQLLGLCLLYIQLTRQNSCNFPGNLLSPDIYLNNSSRDEGDTIWFRCKIPPLLNFTRVVFCKDGKEIQSCKQMENIFAYNLHYKISQEDTGSISCMYQFKDLKNWSNNSGLSNAIYLQQVLESNFRMEERSSISLSLGIGITAAILIIAVISYVMKKQGILKWKATREQHIPSAHTEMESQPSAYSLIQEKQQIHSLDEGGSTDNALHFYAEVTSNQFSRTSSQREETQVVLHQVYSCVKIKRKEETHLPNLCQEEV